MPSILAQTQSQTQARASNTLTNPNQQQPTKKFRTLGLGASSSPSSPTATSTSFDTSSRSNKRKSRQGSSEGVIQTSFYDPIHPSPDLDSSIAIEDMAVDLGIDPARVAHPRGLPTPVRMDTQDGPWAISIAENDQHTYSIYVKSTYLILPQHLALPHELKRENCCSTDS